MLYSVLHFFIVGYYCKLRFESLNSKILQTIKINAFLTRKKIYELITEHNSICNDIKSYDQFWKKYTFALTYSLIPINLMAIQQLFFEELPLAKFGAELNTIVGLLVSHILLNLLMASINKESKKSFKYLLRFYNQIKSNLRLRSKIKVSYI
jgi:hypothetical protein